jgi:hypothetical protein
MMPPERAILPILTGTASGLILWLTTWLGFRQIKAGDDAHWTKRASELFPVLQSARSNVWCVPTVVSLVVAWSFPTPGFWDVLNWFAGVTGAFLGTRPLDRWRGKVPQARRGVLTVLAQGLVGIAGWLVLVGGVVLMPPQWAPTVGWIFLGALVLHISLACGGGIWLSKAFGWMRMADSATCEIVKRLANARAQRPPELLQVDSPDANAVAVAGGRYVLLVGLMTSLLSLSELETILSHELAHTREGWVFVAGRILGSMSMLPWMLIRPLAADIGIIAPMVLALGTLGLLRFNRWLSLRFEHRADSSAIEAPESSAIYAGALLILHEFNLTPATLEKRTSTHPDLYDRMIAAGIGPEFPRPSPAARIGWTGLVFAMALGFLPVWAVAGWLEGGNH